MDCKTTLSPACLSPSARKVNIFTQTSQIFLHQWNIFSIDSLCWDNAPNSPNCPCFTAFTLKTLNLLELATNSRLPWTTNHGAWKKRKYIAKRFIHLSSHYKSSLWKPSSLNARVESKFLMERTDKVFECWYPAPAQIVSRAHCRISISKSLCSPPPLLTAARGSSEWRVRRRRSKSVIRASELGRVRAVSPI